LIQKASWYAVEQLLENDNVGEDCFLVYPKNGNESPENLMQLSFKKGDPPERHLVSDSPAR
jgi:hypothetical protein